ncbi:MAG: Hsp20/alpha crystallin family protein [Gammaproteobacteria bacterium]|nr:Hsp20/alpha crystallin family protein [Gammaproteobacteria bacterium]MCW8841240.1 Hsp20/alpha crystallin family protein [Gammaproteobacteria bacterium]MCW8927556.1 Hsp20/alpha crystallin family protein [Gammaproteobacteria bacterium]MCW8958336.1 Hsp20/alpha crystallin family protein [Gammaproteobacteria bacterium]MCW8972480.1 Hsp20/alpha crystallin family protein [Gammaproteobacteria bacterium]
MAKESKKPATSKGQEIAQQTTQAHPMTPFEEMDRLMESFFPRRWLHPFRWDLPSMAELGAPLDARLPRVDVIDHDNEIVVKAEVPGIEKEDLDVSVADNSVTIKGSTRHEEKEERGDYYRSEIRRGSFSRTVALPAYVDSEKAKASFKDGVLELTLPKVEKSKRKSVTID